MSSAACFRFFVYPYIANLMGISEEKPIYATLKNNFFKKKNFTRFAKSKLNTTKDGKMEVEILKGQESFRIKSFVFISLGFSLRVFSDICLNKLSFRPILPDKLLIFFDTITLFFY